MSAMPAYAPERVTNGDARPTTRQTYALAHMLCDAAGIDYPTTRGEMSALIGRLRDAVPAGQPVQDDARGAEIPF